MDIQKLYSVEYAKSGRSKCRGCNESIEKAALRFSIGKIWFHKDCFFKSNKPKNVDDIANFEDLRADDQVSVRALVGDQLAEHRQRVEDDEDPYENVYDDYETFEEWMDNQSSHRRRDSRNDEFLVGHASSNRSACRYCRNFIDKREVRIAKMDYDFLANSSYNRDPAPIPRWYHVRCFAQMRNQLQFKRSASSIPGFSQLRQEDRDMVMSHLPNNV
ncbi:poly [ADP-ribose] polymerase-like [Neocloeon triangulifer]|uniref:poly [ADP-ribose] polymerase-like n=1 Tax=Neocloeon triangulifer TaxID=2078957 RepID=UPI00286F1993|nr:poly [ADP-ribose] polymerase-like [Neocloeon triangulifer]